ncbi:unnamed protein product [Mortierella alpina]
MLEATTHSATILLLWLLDKVVNILDHRTTRKEPDDIILMEIRLLQKRISDLRARLHPLMAAHEPHYDGPSTQTWNDVRLVELAHLERLWLAELVHLEKVQLAELAHQERMAELEHQERITELAHLERLWLAELVHLEKIQLAELAHQERIAGLALREMMAVLAHQERTTELAHLERTQMFESVP